MSPTDNNEPLVIEGHYVEVEKTVADLLKEPPVKVTIDGKTIEIAKTTLVENPITGKSWLEFALVGSPLSKPN